MFLYRKLDPGVCAHTILRAPCVGASEAAMDTWLHSYAEALDGVAGPVPGLPAVGSPKDDNTPPPSDVRASSILSS